MEARYGSLENLHDQARDSRDLEKKLLEFRGVGPTTVNIFLRELRGIWEKANPRPSSIATEVASKLGLSQDEIEPSGVELALVKIGLEFCKGGKCSTCPMREECQKAKIP